MPLSDPKYSLCSDHRLRRTAIAARSKPKYPRHKRDDVTQDGVTETVFQGLSAILDLPENLLLDHELAGQDFLLFPVKFVRLSLQLFKASGGCFRLLL